MQRALDYALTPEPGVPLRFLLAAPWFGVLAALLLLGDSAFVSRWSAPALGATHLLTLGYLGMAMAGSMLQLIPVVTGRAIPLGRTGAIGAWYGLALGALLLAGALGLHASFLFIPAALLLAGVFATFIAVTTLALARRPPAPAMPMVRGMRLAVAGLAVTLVLGVSLAFALGGALAAPVPVLADLHAAWGLLGWVAMLVVGVAFQVIPMFQSSLLFPAPVTRWAPWLLAALLAAWSAATLLDHAGAALAATLLCAVLAAFAALAAVLLATRKRKDADCTTLYWRLALGSLAASTLLYLLPSHPQAPLEIGIVFIGGFAMGAVNGMLYKIVPFLLWYHLQNDPRAQRGQVPSIRLILPDALGRRQFWCHAVALAALLGAAWWPGWLARPAAVLLAVSSLLLALDLRRAARRCGEVEAMFQPS